MKFKIMFGLLIALFFSAGLQFNAEAGPYRHCRHGYCRPVVRYYPPVPRYYPPARVYVPPVVVGGYYGPRYYPPRYYHPHNYGHRHGYYRY